MQWFSEGLASAILRCRKEKLLFLVYVHDNSKMAISVEQSWDSQDVQGVLRENKHLCFNISKDSQEYYQFSQLYPILVVPCVLCIGPTGRLLVSLSGPCSSQRLMSGLCEACQKVKVQEEDTLGAVGLDPPSTPSSSSHTTHTTPSLPTTSPLSVTDDFDVDMEERSGWKRKAKRDSKKDGGEELKRRADSKTMGEVREAQREREAASWVRERQKQKEEERKARMAVKNQLEQDRRERLTKYGNGSGLDGTDVRQRARMPPTTSPGTSANGSCRVQFRVVAGDTFVRQFEASATLTSLKEAVMEELGVSVREGVSLSRAYPFLSLDDAAMDHMSLVELQLAPSGVVLVRKKERSVGPVGVASSLWVAMVKLFNLLVALLVLIKNTFVGETQRDSPPSSTGRTRSSYHSRRAGDRIVKFKPGGGGGGGGGGNGDGEDDEDDEEKRRSTYNGNSTQQQ